MQNNNYKVAIVGGGSSGILCAIELLSGNNHLKGEDIVILERLDRIGKKLVVTGNGQGNLTNENISSKSYFGDRAFIDDFIINLNKINLKEYLRNLGVALTVDENNKVFPLSKQANSVLDIFRLILEGKIAIKTNTFVKDVVSKGEKFTIKTNNGEFTAQNVVLAVGGKASKQFGTDGSSYILAQKFGHKLSKLYPSLVQLKTDTEKIKVLRGIREEVKLDVLKDGKMIYSTIGDIIFTDYGISGNSVFKCSSYVAGQENIQVKIEFLPSLTAEQIESLLNERKKNTPYIQGQNVLLGIVNKKVGEVIYKNALDKNSKSIVKLLKDFRLNVKGSMGFDNAQVTRGGILTKDIDSKNYSSKLQSNLYLLGEMLDIDGECGGYNLTFAFITAIVSAKNIKNKYLEINDEI